MLTLGDPVPWFMTPSSISDEFRLDLLGGTRIAVAFLGSLGDARAASFWRDLAEAREALFARNVQLVGISQDVADRERYAAICPSGQPLMLWDHTGRAASAFQLDQRSDQTGGAGHAGVQLFLLERGLRVADVVASADIGWDPVRALARIDALWPSELPVSTPGHAPVLILPGVLDQAMCQRLIAAWHESNDESGYSRQGSDGRQYTIIDDRKKRRRDHFLAPDDPLRRDLLVLISRRIVPMVRRAFQYNITRVERYCVACYDAAEGGFFGPHRDFSGPASHRAFAMTLNLNTDQYQGGDLCFPEFGNRLYRADSGSAIIFSGSLLHEAKPVTSGRRFALLSFFYGDREAELRTAYHRQHGTEYETIDLRAKPKQDSNERPSG